jgi:outer membrane biosynthesis protein TonB
VRLTRVGDKTVQVAELREELSKRQLDTSGNKAELVARLTEAMAASDSPAKPEQPAGQPVEPAEQQQEQKPAAKKQAAQKGKKQPAEAAEQPVEAAEQPAEAAETTAQEQKPAKKEAKKGKKRKNPEEAQEPKEAAAVNPVEKTPGCKLFVGNLGKPTNVTEAKVKQLFGASLAHAHWRRTWALEARVQPASQLTGAEVRAGHRAQRVWVR